MDLFLTALTLILHLLEHPQMDGRDPEPQPQFNLISTTLKHSGRVLNHRESKLLATHPV